MDLNLFLSDFTGDLRLLLNLAKPYAPCNADHKSVYLPINVSPLVVAGDQCSANNTCKQLASRQIFISKRDELDFSPFCFNSIRIAGNIFYFSEIKPRDEDEAFKYEKLVDCCFILPVYQWELFRCSHRG